MPRINYKYSINKKVFWKEMYSIPTLHTCKMCEGEGMIVNKLNDIGIKCPNCNGEGKIDSGSGSIKERINSGIVIKAIIEIEKYDNELQLSTIYIISDGITELQKQEYEIYDNENEIVINNNYFCGYTT